MRAGRDLDRFTVSLGGGRIQSIHVGDVVRRRWGARTMEGRIARIVHEPGVHTTCWIERTDGRASHSIFAPTLVERWEIVRG